MAEVLSLPLQSTSRSSFGAPLRRSSSHSDILFQDTSSYTGSSLDLKSNSVNVDYGSRPSASIPSSAPSSPRPAPPDFSNQPSYLSTPSSSLSLDDQCPSEVDTFSFPSYDDNEDQDSPTRGRPLSRSQNVGPLQSPSESALPETPLNTPASHPLLKIPLHHNKPERSIAGDDTAVYREPTRHVDYLSHNWKEEDIWSSWKHVISRRKVYKDSSRLENASWRTWTKTKYRLKTVSPERLNWKKDHDVTWLYGPLHTGNLRPHEARSTPPTSQISRSSSFGSKKPILKRRSLSELMLQRSLSSSTLMKQATDALRAQQPGKNLHERPIFRDRTMSDFSSYSNSTTPSAESATTSSSLLPSATASGQQTPCTKKHIHFNNRVEQCIAINKGIDDHEDFFCAIQDESSSDDEMLTMKPVDHPKANISGPSTPRNSFSGENKTIAMLPCTTLNYRGDTPEPAKQQTKQISSFWNTAPKLKHSPSQETIKPSNKSSNFLLDDEDDELDTNWQPSAGRRGSTYPSQSSTTRSPYNYSEEETDGLRRTSSGMFMPYDEHDDDDLMAAGLLGKVVDTVNTAKDIAHVIWNVGWRR